MLESEIRSGKGGALPGGVRSSRGHAKQGVGRPIYVGDKAVVDRSVCSDVQRYGEHVIDFRRVRVHKKKSLFCSRISLFLCPYICTHEVK